MKTDQAAFHANYWKTNMYYCLSYLILLNCMYGTASNAHIFMEISEIWRENMWKRRKKNAFEKYLEIIIIIILLLLKIQAYVSVLLKKQIQTLLFWGFYFELWILFCWKIQKHFTQFYNNNKMYFRKCMGFFIWKSQTYFSVFCIK